MKTVDALAKGPRGKRRTLGQKESEDDPNSIF